MCLKNSSSKVSLVVRNMSNSHLFLKKGVPVVQVMSTSPVPPTELSPEMEAVLGAEARPEPMSVVARLNLNRLAHWSPGNALAVSELVLAYHDIFALEGNVLAYTSAIEHEIRIENSKPFKERFHCIPPLLLEEVHTSLQDMLEVGEIHPSQSSWCNAVVFVRKKDGTLCFCINFRCLSVWMKKDSYPLPAFRRHWKAWWGQHISHQWISSQASGKSRWLRNPNNTWPSWWVTSDSISLPTCHLGCVIHWQLSSISCKTPWGS